MPTNNTSAATPRHRMIVRGEDMLARVRELIHQGNVRRIIVIGEDGSSILEIPLTAGVIGAIVAPVLVAIGAIAALAKNYTLLIEATTAAPSVTKTTSAGNRARPPKPRRQRTKVA